MIPIFFQICIFWNNLAWPDPFGAFTFLAQIVGVSIFLACNIFVTLQGILRPPYITRFTFQIVVVSIFLIITL